MDSLFLPKANSLGEEAVAEPQGGPFSKTKS